PGAFDHGFLDFQQHHDGVLDVAFADQFDAIDLAAHDVLGDDAGRLHRDALGDGVVPGGHGLAADGGVHRREALGLHADDLDAGLDGARGRGDAADQAAAADGDDHGVEVGLVFQHFQRHGALPGDHRRVVIGMDHDQAALARQFVAVGLGVVEGVAVQHDLGAETARVGDLDGG